MRIFLGGVVAVFAAYGAFGLCALVEFPWYAGVILALGNTGIIAGIVGDAERADK